MGRRRSDETRSGLLSVAVGERPYVVRVREETRGGPVVLDYRDASGRRRKPSLGFSVRDDAGRVVPALKDRALEKARDKAAELRLQRLRADAEPARLSWEGAFALYHDPVRGNLPESKTGRRAHLLVRREFLAFLQEMYGGRYREGIPWNAVKPADVKAYAWQLRAEGKVQTADKHVRILRTMWRWLTESMDFDGLKNPTRGFDFKKLWEGYTPNRPRYSRDEANKILAVSRDVNPRLRLFLALIDDAGSRSAAILGAWRSMLDRPLEIPPTSEQAPFGWLDLPALKGQVSGLTFLTLFERLELARAMWRYYHPAAGVWMPGYLSELEKRYQEEGKDYPLIPGGYLNADGVADPAKESSYRPASYNSVHNWLRQAERRVGVAIVRRRAFHGLRRAWADHTYDEEGLEVTKHGGGWSREETVSGTYIEKVKHGHRAKAREAHERKRFRDV